MKCAFLVTCNQRYLYALNSTINAQEAAGTKADFEIVHGSISEQYMEESKSFDCNIIWTPRDKGNYFSAKYYRALELMDDYDVLCIIDADYFLYTNLNEYFELAAEGKFITGLNARWTHRFNFGDHTQYRWAKPNFIYADFPTFFNTKKHRKFIEDWIKFMETPAPDYMEKTANHPCGTMNRSICDNIKEEDIIELDGWTWIADFMISKYEIGKRDNELYYKNGPNENKKIYGVHNRWWAPSRFEADIKNSKNDFTVFRNTVSTIKDFMDTFNNRKFGKHVTFVRDKEFPYPYGKEK